MTIANRLIESIQFSKYFSRQLKYKTEVMYWVRIAVKAQTSLKLSISDLYKSILDLVFEQANKKLVHRRRILRLLFETKFS